MNLPNPIFNLNYLSIITVMGADSTIFLQGQLSCNIKILTSSQAGIAAYCTAKGRVISTMIVMPQTNGFWLILPSSLSAIVLKRLQMYVLHSQVNLNTLDIHVIGIKTSGTPISDFELPINDFAFSSKHSRFLLKIPSLDEERYLYLTSDAYDTSSLDTRSVDLWRQDDIRAGLPWFEADQTESYTPHMLNLDKLGGISLDKGCYTGQEIIARTHYLGKNKRHMFAGHINFDDNIHPGQSIVDPKTSQTLGHVLFVQSYQQTTLLLMVLNFEAEYSGEYAINNASRTAINLIH